MIYRMTERMFSELTGRNGKVKQTPDMLKAVISYINQSFGLIHEVTELRII